MDMRHLNYLSDIANDDVAHIISKEKTYQGSWKRRGGVGAFMMLARKWDRLESILARRKTGQYDIFDAVREQPKGEDGSVLAEIRDLRNYLLLVESEMVSQGVVIPENAKLKASVPFLTPKEKLVQEPMVPGTPEDGGHHAKQDGG